jgi:hypothetical protein
MGAIKIILNVRELKEGLIVKILRNMKNFKLVNLINKIAASMESI